LHIFVKTASDSLAGPMVQIIFVFLMVIPPYLFLSFQAYFYYKGPAAFINRNAALFVGILRNHAIEEKW